MNPHTQSNSDSRDCGSFFLDAVGPFKPDDVQVQWHDQPRPTCAHVEELIEGAWQRQLTDAQATGGHLYNGRLARLISYMPSGGQLKLNLGPVTFREFVGTNLTNANLRYTTGPEFLADALGVSAAVVTEDNYLLLGMRSRNVAFHAQRLHPLGGIVELGEEATIGNIDPFQTVQKELVQELGIAPQALLENVCLGMVRDRQIVQPELIFGVRVAGQAAEICDTAANASDSYEHTHLVPIRSDETMIVSFIQQNSAQLTPVAIATLLLHGLQRWGLGWFTATRGYLRKVI